MKRKPKGTIWSKRAKLLSTLLAVTLLCTTVFSGFVWAAETDNDASAVQIGNYYQVNDETGALPDQPELQQNETNLATEQSYEDGKVKVNKTISPTSEENVFDVTLTVKTQEKIDTTVTSPDAATVLVIDCSGSMNNNRMSSAKKAAQTFINSFAAEGATRKVAIVRYSGSKNTAGYDGANTVQAWTDASTLATANNTTYCDAIKKLSAGGATNTEAGLMLGRNLLNQLKNDPELGTIENLNVILLTDGNPTLGVLDSAESKYATETSKICPQDDRGYSIDDEGAGNATSCSTHEDVETMTASLKASGYGTYAVYVGDQNVNCSSWDCNLNKSGARWLAEDCGFTTYSAADSELDKLIDIFKKIVELIEMKAQAWIVTDPMGENIDFVGFGTTTNLVNEFTEKDGTITWDIKNSTRGSESTVDGVTTTTYEMTYRIKLDTLADNYVAGKYYATNGVTGSTYLITETENGTTNYVDGTAYFNVPSVKGFDGSFSFNKVDGFGGALSGAKFTLTTPDKNGWSMTAEADANGVVSFDHIPSGHSYILTETEAPDGYVGTTVQYEVSVNFGEVTVSGMEGNKVTNTSETLDISGTKVWNDGNDKYNNRPSEITINLTGTVGDAAVVNKTTTASKDTNWEWEFRSLPKYKGHEEIQYSITEKSVDGYESKITGNVTDGYTVTNTQTVTDAIITKNVTGLLGDVNKDFTFEAIVKDASGNQIKLDEVTEGDYTIDENGVIHFNLKHTESVVIEDLPLGAILEIKETDATWYYVTVTAVDDIEDTDPTVVEGQNEDSYSVGISDGLNITVTNEKTIIPDTGIFLDTLPYIISLQLVLIGAIAFILRKRNLEDNE